MNKHIIFVTGNSDKFNEVEGYIKQLDPSIILEQVPLELPEIQSLDIRKIARAKAEEAWRVLQKPLIVDDGGIYLARFNNFPGPLIKFVYEGMGLDNFWNCLAKDDPRASFISLLAYADGPDHFEFFEGICTGKMIEPTGIITRKGMPFTDMFVPDGTTKTLNDIRGTPDEPRFHHRRISCALFVEWLQTHS